MVGGSLPSFPVSFPQIAPDYQPPQPIYSPSFLSPTVGFPSPIARPEPIRLHPQHQAAIALDLLREQSDARPSLSLSEDDSVDRYTDNRSLCGKSDTLLQLAEVCNMMDKHVRTSRSHRFGWRWMLTDFSSLRRTPSQTLAARNLKSW